MKKIVLVIKNAYSWAGTENICHFMSECLGPQHEVSVYSLEGSGQPFYPFEQVQQIVSFSGESHPLKSAVKRIQQQQFDAVFLISMGRLSVMFALYSMMTLRKKTAKIYACEHVALNSFSKIIKLLKYLTLRYYDRVIVLTDKDRQLLTGWKIASKTIPNPVVYKNYQRSRRHYQALAVGRLDQQKGFDLLLDIWQGFVAKNAGWKLVIAGEGDLKDQLMAQAARLNISDSVDFIGRVSNIDDYYRDSDMVLMTSRYEGLPLVLLEAKSWSLPVVAYDCPTGPQEIINHQLDGFLVAMNDQAGFIDSMNQLARYDQLFFSMCASTKVTARRFDVDVIKETWLSLV